MFKLNRGMFWRGLAALAVLALLTTGCAANATHSGQGTVMGHTLSAVAGIPGALSGHPDLNWKRPEPEPTPNERVYFLMIDEAKQPQLFSTLSDKKGAYKIRLPEGGYFFEAASRMSGWLGEDKDKESVINALLTFAYAQRDAKGNVTSTKEPDIVLKAGQTVKQDIPAQVMYVD